MSIETIEIIDKFYNDKCVDCGFKDVCHKNNEISILSIKTCQDNDLYVKTTINSKCGKFGKK